MVVSFNDVVRVVVEGGQLPDEPGPFHVEGATPGAPVEVRVSWLVSGTTVSSAAWFVAGPDGQVDPRRQPAFAGSYSGIDPFGLFWTARAADGSVPSPGGNTTDTDVEVTLTSSGTQAVGMFPRRTRADWVIDDPVTDHGLVGRFLHGPGAPRPGVVVIGGSDGGLTTATRIAGLLASRGLNALALAYFGLPGLPRHLQGVPVEYVHTALGWLGAHPAITGNAASILGVSRGGELALLAASTCPHPLRAVAAITPTVYLWPALTDPGEPPAAAWTLHGRPLPFLPEESPAVAAAVEGILTGSGTDPAAPYMEAAIATTLPNDRTAARIPVDRIACPVLLATGGADALWPSAQHCADIVDHRGAGHHWEHLTYTGAGHRISLFPTAPISTRSDPVGGPRLEFGGTDQATAAAAADLWARLPTWFAQSAADTT